MNCGKDLLPADSVAFLLNALTRCAEDLKSDPVPGGPCLVYHRPGLEALLDSPAAYCRGEAMDDWVAMLMKYGLPCLSITRSEWIETVEADAFIFPAPAAVGPSLARVSLECLRRGTPIAWMGQASLLPDGLQQALGVNVTRPPRESALAGPATLEDPELAAAVGTRGVVLNQRQRSLSESPSWQPVISALGGPVFSRHRTMPSWIWETPEWGTPEDLHLTVKSVESLQTYVAVSRALGRAGWGRERLGWQNRDWTRPVVFHFWRYAAGRLGVLLGNLETGLTGHSQCYAHGSIEASRPLTAIAAEAGSEPVVLSATGTRCAVGLGPHKSCILRMEART
jgi:hypothetical protein